MGDTTTSHTRGALILRAAPSALCGLALLTGCSAPPETAELSVDVQLEVCQASTCFTAPVPAARVTVAFGGQTETKSTDAEGTAAFRPSGYGPASVTAQWGELTQTTHTGMNPGAQSLTLRFTQPARVSPERR